jgi:hypothetical protein
MNHARTTIAGIGCILVGVGLAIGLITGTVPAGLGTVGWSVAVLAALQGLGLIAAGDGNKFNNLADLITRFLPRVETSSSNQAKNVADVKNGTAGPA